MNAPLSSPTAGSSLFDAADRETFAACFNKTSFLLKHSLPDTGLFTLPRIAELANAMLASGRKDTVSALHFKDARLDSKFTSLAEERQLTDIVERLSNSGSWIKLTRVQDFDTSCAAVLNAMIDDIESLSGVRIRQDLTWATMTLFLASPGISTPYHIDHESNFLFQVQGSKEVCLFSQDDRELLPDREIERFYNGNAEAARYRSELQHRGTVFHLGPGLAVHHPPLAPHWVKNGQDISVSVSVGFCLKPLERRARVYQANFVLRQLGLRPRGPGLSRTGDRVKTGVMSILEKRRPETYQDVVFAPMSRLKAPFRLVRG
ncbi:hypothetical protein P7D22_03570 [Lichenihabitans sp. Uapishka_5]|uniref:hypothetical protein n=1 Tax=Lichenihabitans sp. Uapishka_5 TaxID=3037302 RepID=UPI0029E7DDBE|nr:hypothetical protein [Lichenihabitans sp. Uapishka_5]MDX7950257.1 hypothetical protein [Lichenihabitans sp. Uapishka_5]